MRMELPLLSGRDASGDDAQLAPSEVQPGTREDFAIAFDDHPRVDRRMQPVDVVAKAVIHRAVDSLAGFAAAPFPFAGVADDLGVLRRRGHEATPLSESIECSGKAGEQICLQK